MQIGLTFVLVPPILAAVIYILKSASPYMPLYLWAFLVCLQLVVMTVYPTLIAPLFNKYSPLEEGPLRTGIEELASTLKFPLKKLFVVDGSKRSGHSNAYMYGFGKNKRIVLYDTLLSQCNPQQVRTYIANRCIALTKDQASIHKLFTVPSKAHQRPVKRALPCLRTVGALHIAVSQRGECLYCCSKSLPAKQRGGCKNPAGRCFHPRLFLIISLRCKTDAGRFFHPRAGGGGAGTRAWPLEARPHNLPHASTAEHHALSVCPLRCLPQQRHAHGRVWFS